MIGRPLENTGWPRTPRLAFIEKVRLSFVRSTGSMCSCCRLNSRLRLGAVGILPVGSVPLGHDDINLPLGMAFVGRRYDGNLSFMSVYEADFPVRKVPHLLE